MKYILSISNQIKKFFLLDAPGKFTALDGLKGWAAMSVFIFHFSSASSHYYGQPGSWSNTGKIVNNIFQYFPLFGFAGAHIGVDVFFILSGFFIYRSIKRKNFSFFSFLVNRYKRLLPAHVIILFHTLTVSSVLVAFINIFFLNFFFPKVTFINFVTWSISYEILFYVICALWLIVGKNIKMFSTWKFLFVLILAIYSTQWFLPNYFTQLGMQYIALNRFIAFFFGVILSKLYTDDKALWVKYKRLFLYGAFPSFLMICLLKYIWSGSVIYDFFVQKGFDIPYLLVDIAAFILIGFLLLEEDHIISKFFNFLPLRIIGVVSYSFYLNHAIWGLSIGARLIDDFRGAASKAILYYISSFIVTFLIAVFMYHFLEKPYFTKSQIKVKKTKRNSKKLQSLKV